jgi:nitrogen fixation-related uncharacterized protein
VTTALTVIASVALVVGAIVIVAFLFSRDG